MEGYRATDEFDESKPPSFAEVLAAVVDGRMLGFHVFDGDGDISFYFCDGDDQLKPLDPEELRVPITSEQAREMLKELPPEELNEAGVWSTGFKSGLS